MKRTDPVSRLVALFCLSSLLWLLTGRFIIEGAVPFLDGFKISFLWATQIILWIFRIIPEMQDGGLTQIDTTYGTTGACLGLIAGFLILSFFTAGVCCLLMALFRIVVGEKQDDEVEPPQVIITAMGNGILLKFDGFRESNQWTVINGEGRVGDYESEDKALEVIDLLKGDLI